jgi:hypothetical protein
VRGEQVLAGDNLAEEDVIRAAADQQRMHLFLEVHIVDGLGGGDNAF